MVQNSTKMALHELGLDDLSNFDGRGILNTTCQCAKASCLTDDMGECMQSFDRCSDFIDGESDEWDVLGRDLCFGVKQELNNDLTGPGVSSRSKAPIRVAANHLTLIRY
jgi:hypothetical protein